MTSYDNYRLTKCTELIKFMLWLIRPLHPCSASLYSKKYQRIYFETSLEIRVFRQTVLRHIQLPIGLSLLLVFGRCAFFKYSFDRSLYMWRYSVVRVVRRTVRIQRQQPVILAPVSHQVHTCVSTHLHVCVYSAFLCQSLVTLGSMTGSWCKSLFSRITYFF